MADETLPTLNELLSADLSRVRYALHAAGIWRGNPAEGVAELAAREQEHAANYESTLAFVRGALDTTRLELAKVQAERDALAASLTSSHEARAERAELVKDRDWALGELDKARAEALHARGGWLEANHRRDEAIRERDAIREDLARARSHASSAVQDWLEAERGSAARGQTITQLLRDLAAARAIIAEHVREREALSPPRCAYLAVGPDAALLLADLRAEVKSYWQAMKAQHPEAPEPTQAERDLFG